MSQMVIGSIACACLISAILVPAVRAAFRSLGIVDQPDRERKLHATAVPLGGGLAVFLCVGISVPLVMFANRLWGNAALESAGNPWGVLFAAAAALLVVGLLDDAFALRGRQKLLCQLLVVSSVVGSGTLVQHLHWFGYDFHLGVFAYPLTVLWLLAAINALNLIDGADGMASTAGAIISCGLAVLCVQSGDPVAAVVSAALAGALLGFLFYNRPPATIYLGDAGSMVIGLFVGVISIWSSVKDSTLLSIAPLVVLTVPLFDSLIAILRRVLTGRSIYASDRGHLHHRLLDRFSHPTMLVVVAALCSVCAGAAVLSFHLGQQWIAVAGGLLVIGLLVSSCSFGNAELTILASRALHFGQSLLVRSQRSESSFHHRAVQLQGDLCWDAIWMSLVEFANERELSQIKLDVGIAWLQEGYHGSWRRVPMPERVDQASLKIPLFIDGRCVGRLEAIADARAADLSGILQLLIERTDDLGIQIQSLMAREVQRALPVQALAARSESSGVPTVTLEHASLTLTANAAEATH